MINKYTASSALLLITANVFATSSPLTYDYITPYTGGGTLTVHNVSASPITINQLNFTSNVGITASPWGTLWGWQSTLQNKSDPDGVNTDYSIIENPVVTIPAGSSASLSYTIASVAGPLAPYNTGMPPSNISAITPNGTINAQISGACSGAACNDPGNGKRIMGYYINWAYWHTPKFTADQLPFDKVNTIAYAFSIFDSNGNISLYDQDSDAYNIPLLSQERQRYPYLNLSLSFGGWSWASTPKGWQCKTGVSPNGPAACFVQMASDSAATDKFVKSAVGAMKEVGFNGIDIDWEYPSTSADIQNYIVLLQKLRTALDAQGSIDHVHYYLTIATPAGIDKIQKFTSTQWQTIAETVDYVDVMTYDFHGDWDKGSVPTDFQSAMQLDPNNDPTANSPVLGKYDVIDAIQAYLDAGVPAKKIVVGIPLYGRMTTIASSGNMNGLYQPITGTPQGEWDNQQSGFTGMIDYRCIADSSSCGNGFKLPALTLEDPTKNIFGKYAMTPWGYSNGFFVTYDDSNSAAYKANWIKSKGLGGAMLWDLTEDFPDSDNRSIVNAVYRTFQS